MSDRELLELAAKAVGYDTSHPWNKQRMEFDPPVIALCIRGVSTGWNPLEDDGDAQRLAVKLEIVLSFERPREVSASRFGDGFEYPEEWTEHNGDRNAATRRAIVRAAAEIGRAQ